MINYLVKKYKDEARWVNYKLEEVEGKTTKIPYSISGKKASSTDPTTWSTYEEAWDHSPNVGIVFTPDQKLLGIDIDHCLKGKQIVHPKQELIADLILNADTYTEISPSKTGLHLFLALTAPLSLTTNRKEPFELYTKGRYFTFTGNSYGKQKEVRTVTPEEAIHILSTVGYPWGKKTELPKEQANTTPNSYDVLEKMFSSKHGDKIKALYNGDISAYENDHSRADMALLSHLAFWTQKNPEEMRKLWLASPLAERPKVAGGKREDYIQRTIGNAIANCKEVYTPPAPVFISEDLDLLYTLTSKGQRIYTLCTENIYRILKFHSDFQGRFRLDVFKNVLEIQEKGQWRALIDSDIIHVQTQISILYTDFFAKVGKEMTFDAIVLIGKDNMIDSAADYIKSLKWDGVNRLDTWLNKVYGCNQASAEFYSKIGANWIKGMVKRLIQPGCKFDYVLVLEGPQGIRKSSSLLALGGDWHVETTADTNNKDFFMQFAGKAIIEFSEGETLSRTEVKRMKAIITMQTDRYRPPYGKVAQDFPRRSVFAMTTNQDKYLKDETGNRRWWPVKVETPKIDVEWIKENREQMFAEAYHRLIVLHETVYEYPEEEAQKLQSERRVSDPNEEVITEWYYTLEKDKKDQGITIFQVYGSALSNNLSYPSKKMTKTEEMSIANVLKEVLGLEKKQIMVGGIRRVRWFEKGAPELSEYKGSVEEQTEINYKEF